MNAYKLLSLNAIATSVLTNGFISNMINVLTVFSSIILSVTLSSSEAVYKSEVAFLLVHHERELT